MISPSVANSQVSISCMNVGLRSVGFSLSLSPWRAVKLHCIHTYTMHIVRECATLTCTGVFFGPLVHDHHRFLFDVTCMCIRILYMCTCMHPIVCTWYDGGVNLINYCFKYFSIDGTQLQSQNSATHSLLFLYSTYYFPSHIISCGHYQVA